MKKQHVSQEVSELVNSEWLPVRVGTAILSVPGYCPHVIKVQGSPVRVFMLLSLISRPSGS